MKDGFEESMRAGWFPGIISAKLKNDPSTCAENQAKTMKDQHGWEENSGEKKKAKIIKGTI